MTALENKALTLIRTRTNAQLLEMWEETEKQLTSLESFRLRGWIMEVMEERDQEGFDAWMDNEDISKDNPKNFLFH